MVDFIGRFETLVEDFALVSTKITGNPLKLPHKNKTGKQTLRERIKNLGSDENSGHYNQYYDQQSRDFVAKIYKKDIELFGYEFD